MFLITTAYQKSRSKQHPDKPGKVLFHISYSQENEEGCVVRSISSDIYGERDTVLVSNRSEIVRYIRVIYSIIEKHDTSKYPFSIDDIADDFRLVIKGDESMKSLLKRAEEEFPIRADLVSIGKEFKRDFQFLYPETMLRPDSLLAYIDMLSQLAKSKGKESQSRSYNSTSSSLSKFLCDRDIPISSIDRSFVANYSSWLKQNGVADSTQSFYLRTLRSIVNCAKEDGINPSEGDLFKGMNTRVVFSDAKENNTALDREILNKIANLKFKEESEVEIVRDMFMFGFYCHGMELTDIMSLTNHNIQGIVLTYNRRGVGKPRNIVLDKLAFEIIKKYYNPNSNFLFPLSDIYKGVQQYTIAEKVRKHVKEIGKAVGFPKLTFTMNISSWQQLISQINISEILNNNK